MMPPAKSQPNPAGDSAFTMGTTANTHSQPMAMYSTEENHLGQVIHRALMAMPARATAHTAAHSAVPCGPRSVIRQMGV